MRKVKLNAFLSGLCAFAVVLGVVAAGARADVTTEKGASILVFPKVRAGNGFDTIVQIANTGNKMVFAHCFYVDGSLVNTLTQQPCDLPGQLCVPSCLETDFSIWLTKQQPTHWRVSTGRQFNPLDKLGSDGAGFDPGFVPPVPTTPGFLGELKCIEVDESGAPVTGNHLKGEATLMTTAGDVSKYNAIGIAGDANLSPTNPLLLDGTTYDACPAKTILNHFATGATDPVVADFPPGALTATEATELTLVPCSEDFEHQAPTTVTLKFRVTNEFEDTLSFSTTLSCFLNAELANLGSLLAGTSNPFTLTAVGSDVASTEITPAPNTDGTVNAVIGVAERIVTVTTAGSSSARAAYNLHTQGDLIAVPPDQIVLPGDP
jgi:hypothetical protein